MVQGFSNVLTAIFDVLVLPFGSNRTAALWGISLVTGIVLIFLFKYTSNQDRIKATRDAFSGRILEMRIYQDDLGLILKALGAALWSNVAYLRASLVPILVPGDTTLLTVTLKDGVDPMTTPIRADGGGAVTIDAPPVRVEDRREVNWRVRADSVGVHPFTVTVYDTPYEFPVFVAASNRSIGYTRHANSHADALFHPGLPAIPKNSALQSVHLDYPARDYSLVFWQTPWWLVFIVVVSVGALIPKFIFRIQI
jgi:hypothetical protein